jgi:hypothetical protein
MSCGDGVGVGDGVIDGVGDGLVDGVGDGLVDGVGDGPIDGDGDALTMCRLSTASDPAHEAFAAQKPTSKSSASARICGDRIEDSPLERCRRELAIGAAH